MRPRWTLYVKFYLGKGLASNWHHEDDFFWKRNAWKRADDVCRWHPCDSKIVRYGEPYP